MNYNIFYRGTKLFYRNINEIYMKILCHEISDKCILYIVSYPEITNHNLNPQYISLIVEKRKERERYE